MKINFENLPTDEIMTPPMVLQINILQNEKGQAPLHAIGVFLQMEQGHY